MATLEIEIDPSLDETLCLSCGRPAAHCLCSHRARVTAAQSAQARGMRRRLAEELARIKALPGWEGLRALARLMPAAPRWLSVAALRHWRRKE